MDLLNVEGLVLPDFDSYPCAQSIQTIDLINDGILILWDDGLESSIPGIWLRDFCPKGFHPVVREQITKLVDIPRNLSIEKASVSDDGFLLIDWLPEKFQSRYHPGWLRAWCSPTSNAMFDLPRRRLWEKQFIANPTWYDGRGILEGNSDDFEAWVESIHITGLGLLNGLPTDAAVIPELPEKIGPVRISNFGKVFKVFNRKETNTNANTALSLSVHSDLSTREYMPGLQFLFCIINDAKGGNSILADGFAIAEQLKVESKEFYEVLASTPIPFGTRDKETDHRVKAPVLEHDHTGSLTNIRYTYWLRLPMTSSFDTITTFYHALRRFQEIADNPDNQMNFRLSPGEMMAFDNRRILHGRDAFDPLSGDRLLHGCYGEREELASCLRMIARRKRSRAS